MYSLHLRCAPDEVDLLSAALWEESTAGIRELEDERGVLLIAGFEDNRSRSQLLETFARFEPQWFAEAAMDWVQATRDAWPARTIGDRLFLAPPWCQDETPPGRLRILHNPGLACGTGEHPCTRLALAALENVVAPGTTLADIGTGSGLLAISAARLGAERVFGIDPDEAALQTARENFLLNGLDAQLVVGSADCLRSESVHVAVANISATVLLAIADDLIGILRPAGTLVLTGFSQSEEPTVHAVFGPGRFIRQDGWSCLISSPAISPVS